MGFLLNRIIFDAGLALLGIGVGYRALFGAVTLPAVRAGRTFRTDVAAFFTGCFISEVIADGAAGYLIAGAAAIRQGDRFVTGFAGGAGRVPTSGCVAGVGAAITFQSGDVFHILIGIVAVSGLALFGKGMRGRTNGIVIIVIVVIKQQISASRRTGAQQKPTGGG